MLSFWKRLWDGVRLSPENQVAPTNPEPVKSTTAPAPVVQSKPAGVPNTYQAYPADERVDRREVFEPALKQFPRAVRQSEPVIHDKAVARRWYATRNQLMGHLLQLVGGSRWRDKLVLRGSLLLKIWLGDQAREPGDIDWVVRPPSIRMTEYDGKWLISGLVEIVCQYPLVSVPAGRIEIGTKEITRDDIWTYDRAPGRRIVIPWRTDDLPAGIVQLDFVFGEELWCEPVETPIPTVAGGSVSLWTASKEQSLAWKIHWLENDMYPQGKDLYDATLLAEQVHLPFELLQRAMNNEYRRMRGPLKPDFARHLEVDWENFQNEYPRVQGSAAEWQERLTKALAPTFAGRTE